MLRRSPLKSRTTLERSSRLSTLRPMRKRRSRPRRSSRIIDEPRLTWMREQPCCACGRPLSSVPHHSRHDDDGRPVGAGRKANDDRTMPLCWDCHVLLHARNGRFRHIDVLAWENEQIAQARAAYLSQQAW
jgi:hypothetical protein